MINRPLTDNDVHDLLCKAREVLGSGESETVRGQTALIAARRALVLLQIALVSAMEAGTHLSAVMPDDDAIPD